MSLKLRLSRGGAKKRPHYRIVVADSRMPRDGRFIERVGTYNPMLPRDHPERVVIKEDRVRHWLERGAKPSARVARFLGGADVIPMPEWRETPKKSAPKAKALQRIEEAEAAAREAAAAPPPPPEPEPAPAEAPEAPGASGTPPAAEDAPADGAPPADAAEDASGGDAAPEPGDAPDAPDAPDADAPDEGDAAPADDAAGKADG